MSNGRSIYDIDEHMANEAARRDAAHEEWLRKTQARFNSLLNQAHTKYVEGTLLDLPTEDMKLLTNTPDGILIYQPRKPAELDNIRAVLALGKRATEKGRLSLNRDTPSQALSNLVPFLRRPGIRKLDFLSLTQDHFNSIREPAQLADCATHLVLS